MSKHALQMIAVLSAALFAIAPAANAEMFKWVNDDGTTTYSNEPPTDPSSVTDFMPVDIPRMDSPRPIVIVPSPPKAAPEIAAARPSVRAQLPQAVQDPCLTSWDPLCSQKNKDHYRPYVGYAPNDTTVAEVPSVIPPARGATTGASGGGVLGAGTRLK